MNEDTRREMAGSRARAARGTDKCEMALSSPFADAIGEEQLRDVYEMASLVNEQLIFGGVIVSGSSLAVIKATIMGTYLLGYMGGKGIALLPSREVDG